eukprot:TRINITY_DN2570_c0_g1_i1.p1 TRINITY_DN2570_c0_g1~~TRINITY_DN2570_c0_g1_i1.p1  ORF type:complete len:237 (+),score=46.94 TRINITY_DN2570_c0_g1_i1:63-713(+)
MVELKGMVKKALEKKGVLNRIRAELRASLFEVIEEQDQQQQAGSDAAEQGQGTVRGCCTEQARQMHETKSGQLLTALLCEYFEWADLSHTLKVYLPEANLLPVYPRRAKLEEELGLSGSSSSSVVSGSHQPPRPLIFDVLQTFLASKAGASTTSSRVSSGASSGGGGTASSSVMSLVRGAARSASPTGSRGHRSSSPVLARTSSGPYGSSGNVGSR